MKIALIGFLLLIVAVSILYLCGRFLPEDHRATISFVVAKPRPVVWAALTDYAAMPRWWPAVKSVRIEKGQNGETLTWNTDAHGREVAFRTKEEIVPEKLVREIVGADLPFGGTWTYLLSEENGGTKVTLIEDGIIRPPLLRAFARYFYGLDRTMKDFADHFGADVATR